MKYAILSSKKDNKTNVYIFHKMSYTTLMFNMD